MFLSVEKKTWLSTNHQQTLTIGSFTKTARITMVHAIVIDIMYVLLKLKLKF